MRRWPGVDAVLNARPRHGQRRVILTRPPTCRHDLRALVTGLGHHSREGRDVLRRGSPLRLSRGSHDTAAPADGSFRLGHVTADATRTARDDDALRTTCTSTSMHPLTRCGAWVNDPAGSAPATTRTCAKGPLAIGDSYYFDENGILGTNSCVALAGHRIEGWVADAWYYMGVTPARFSRDARPCSHLADSERWPRADEDRRLLAEAVQKTNRHSLSSWSR